MSETELQPRRGPGRPSNAELAAREQPAPESAALPQRKRIPFGSVAQKLAYEAREGYHRHWFNDAANRIHRALEAGYEHVKGRDGKNVSRIVGVAEGGGPLHAFLMEIPEDWYKEDMAREQQLIDEKENAIKSGKTQGAEVEKGYVPSQGISIKAK
jgi:hypothetical protein